MYHYTLYFLNMIGIVVNAFVIGITSKWAKTNIGSLQNLLIFILAYEVIKFLSCSKIYY